MNKFKVGDIVKGGENTLYSFTNKFMTKGEVVKVDESGEISIRCIEHKTSPWVRDVIFDRLNPKYFELVENNPEIRIYRKRNKVIAKNIATGEKGIARCCPEDEFDFDYGARLALRRLTAAKVGDKVKIIGDFCCHGFENGTILTIDSVAEGKKSHLYRPKENGLIYITEHDFIKCIEEDVLYNGKVVCIETFCPVLTVGKIYAFKDGRLTYDDGVKSSRTYKSFEDVKKSFESKFIEVVE